MGYEYNLCKMWRERKRDLEGGGGEKEAGYWMSRIIKTGRKKHCLR